MKVDTHETKPIKIWATDLEEGAMQQARNLANLPFTFSHVALMPDAHFGYGMPIGGVLATTNVVIPNAVGVDIGCGMCSMETTIKEWTEAQLKEVLGLIRQRVPTGFKKRKEPTDKAAMPESNPFLHVVNREYKKAELSLGTLGGGNHFIELQTCGKHLWVMIHSGSRNLGKQVADYYNRLAKDLNSTWYSNVPAEWDLAFLPLQDKLLTGASYLDEMQYCVDYAYKNRLVMMREVADCLTEVFGLYYQGPFVSIAHNYAAQEHHFNHNVVVHRKGATLARQGTTGIIPGSQGTASYIVKGLGNTQSFHSCSHGAGRRMGRKQAVRELDLELEQNRMDGIIHSVRNEKDLDEAPGAYKDIDEVMRNQEDLVETLTELAPLASVKG